MKRYILKFLKMEQQDVFQIKYDGPALTEGTIDVNDLAPALLALGDLFQEANQLLTKGEATISLKVKADFEKGSFTINLQVIQSCINRISDIFTGQEATALLNLLKIIGVTGLYGLFQFIKKAKGKKPNNAVIIEKTNKVRVEFEGDLPTEVQREVWELYNNPRARKATEKVVYPVTREGIDKFALEYKKERNVEIQKEEAKSFAPIEDERELSESTREVMLSIVALSFTDRYVWRFKLSQDTYFAAYIRDEQFQKRISAGENFSAKDLLYVRLKEKQKMVNGQLKVDYEILEVLDHIKSSEGQLPFWESKDKKKQEGEKNEWETLLFEGITI